jgi:hypothetical protein
VNVFYWRFLIILAFVSSLVWADTVPPVDTRINLSFTAQERIAFLAEMRKMLASIQGIVQGIGESDRNRIAEFARLSGNRMARATPASVRSKLPQSFRDIGGPTHMMFEELAIRAETDEYGDARPTDGSTDESMHDLPCNILG